MPSCETAARALPSGAGARLPSCPPACLGTRSVTLKTKEGTAEDRAIVKGSIGEAARNSHRRRRRSRRTGESPGALARPNTRNKMLVGSLLGFWILGLWRQEALGHRLGWRDPRVRMHTGTASVDRGRGGGGRLPRVRFWLSWGPRWGVGGLALRQELHDWGGE